MRARITLGLVGMAVLGAYAAAAALATPTAGLVGTPLARGTAGEAGALQLNAAFRPTYKFDRAYCQPGAPVDVECVRFVGTADISGLGRATVTYTKTLGDVPGCIVTQFRTAVIDVAGKGAINLSLPGTVCGPPAPAVVGPLEIAITSGSGLYAGAFGGLRFSSSVYRLEGACGCGTAADTWTGTLFVPGLDFDVTAPALTGAVSKTVRAPRKAKRVRVRYTVAAQDAVEGSVRVACTPRSGTWFKRGRTRVACSAADSSANMSQARFTVTVR